MKKGKRIFSCVAAVILMLSVFVMGGCFDTVSWERPLITSQSGVWVYRMFDSNDDSAGIVLVSILDVSAVVGEDEFLLIPTNVDGHMVTQLGDIPQMFAGHERKFYEGEERIDRIVIPKGVFVQRTFWHRLYLADYVEFLAEQPSFRLGSFWEVDRITLIVPDGSRERYLEHSDFGSPNIVEKSEIDN